MPELITSVKELTFSISELPEMPKPEQVLMVDPEFFTVEYVINPHMAHNIGKIDKEAAKKEWEQIKDTFEKRGFELMF